MSEGASSEPGAQSEVYRRPDGTFAPGVIQPNSKPFEKGNRANPIGAKAHRTARLRRALERFMAEGVGDGDSSSEREKMAAACLWEMAKTDPAAQKLLWDRYDGPLVKEIEHGVSEGTTIELVGVKLSRPPDLPGDTP